MYKNADDFSSIVALGGPFPPLPFTPEGDDLNAAIDAHRTQFPMYEHMVTMDPPDHTKARSLLSRLLTPKRLKENEDFMWRLADRQLDEFLAEGHSEFLAEYAKPFSLLVIADLLGVPEEDHQEFRVVLGAERPGARVGSLATNRGNQSAGVPRREVQRLPRGPPQPPREDVLTDLATANYPDGSTPEIIDVVRTATFLFAAGQETTTKLLSAAIRCLRSGPRSAAAA